MKKDAKGDNFCKVLKIFSDVFQGEKRGLFGMESRAHDLANQLELSELQNEIESYNRGYSGSVRKCPKCGKKQYYKGDRERILRLQSGELKVKRAYYCCEHCGQKDIPLDEKLGIVTGQEQGALREKLSLLSTLIPYNQAPAVSRVLLGSDEHASGLRRLTMRESERLESGQKTTLDVSSEDTLCVEIDGHMCPTREERRGKDDQGYREVKAVVVFKENEVAEVSKNRREILNQVLEAKACPASEFREIVEGALQRAKVEEAQRVVVRADGAPWIWNLAEELVPDAIQILDYAHMKSYLHDAAKIIFGSNADLSEAWTEKQKELLFNDGVSELIKELKSRSSRRTELKSIVTYFENNSSRMLYGTYEKMNLGIGSGAIESAGKRLAAGRIKGSGMRWNIDELNRLLQLRCTYYEGSWSNYWLSQYRLAA